MSLGKENSIVWGQFDLLYTQCGNERLFFPNGLTLQWSSDSHQKLKTNQHEAVAREGHYPVEGELSYICIYLLPLPPGRSCYNGSLGRAPAGATVRPFRWLLALLSVYGCGGLWRHGVVAVGA